MKWILSILLLVSIHIAFAHQNHTLGFQHVELQHEMKQKIIRFELNHLDEFLVLNAQVDLLVNGQSLAFVNILNDDLEALKSGQLLIPSYLKIEEDDYVQLSLRKINGVLGNYAIEDVDYNPKQYDDVGAYELFADAPWRMDIYDTSNDKNSIPIHLMLHDGDGISYPWIQYVDISFKRSTDAGFGAPINFSGLTAGQFDALFSSKSTADAVLDRKDFDNSVAVRDNNHTIAFRENFYNPWFGASYYYTSLQNFLWYSTINIPESVISSYLDTDYLDVKVEFTIRNTFLSNPVTYLRIFRQAESVPTIADWYRGDTHLHSIYTQNTAEQGLDLSATKEAAKLTGLDWIISTDHTSDFDNYGSGNVNTNWNVLGNEIISLNNADADMLFIRGQEVALQNSAGDLVHFLGYPSYANPTSSNFLGDGDGDVTATSITVDNALANLHANNGFAYAAHPFATGDELSPLVGGGIWNLGDNDFATNGSNFPETGGNIICNDPNIPSDILVNNGNSATKFIKDAMKGGQIWNERVTLSTTDDPQDPYNIQGGNTPFASVPNDLDFYWNRFSQGFEVVKFVNQKGLLLKNTYPSIENWKFYFSAGSDAHGSFNYSNTNSIQSFVGALGGSIQNSAVGKVSTIAYAPNGMGLHGANILKAMHDGNISLSDGPILVQGWSTDGNNPSNELFMGEDLEVMVSDTDQLFLNLQYASSLEFGLVDSVTIIIGTSTGETSVKIQVTGTSSTMSISTLIANVGGIPMDEYFYVRHSLETTKIYGVGTPQIITNETFHSLTNPVWLKLMTPITLPVELLSFEALKVDNTVVLNWKTATEINNEGFEIQRSIDGLNWSFLAWAKGNGNSTSIHNYQKIDFEPKYGKSYYRLKQIDYNGDFEYSNVEAISFAKKMDLEVYPNPVKDVLYLRNIENGSLISVYNLLGQLVYSQRYVQGKSVNLSELIKGAYFIEISLDNDKVVKQIIKS